MIYWIFGNPTIHVFIWWTKMCKKNFGDRNAHFLGFRGLKIDKYYCLLYKYIACNNCANVFMHWVLLNNLFWASKREYFFYWYCAYKIFYCLPHVSNLFFILLNLISFQFLFGDIFLFYRVTLQSSNQKYRINEWELYSCCIYICDFVERKYPWPGRMKLIMHH